MSELPLPSWATTATPVGCPPPPDPGLTERGAPRDHWVRRAADKPAGHECVPPMREQWITPPPAAIAGNYAPGWEGAPPKAHRMPDVPDGAPGDLWRCRCGRLWTVRPRLSPDHFKGAVMGTDPMWLPAGLWRRLRSAGR